MRTEAYERFSMFVKILQEWKAEGFTKTDKQFFLWSSLSLFFLFVLLYFNYQDPDELNKGKQVGIVFVKKNVVRRRPDSGPSWISVQRSYPVREKDMIRTGAESEAILYIMSKFKIDMDENTTIVLDFLEESQKGRIRLEQGSVRFRQTETERKELLNLEIVDEEAGSFHVSSFGELLLTRNRKEEKLRIAVLNDKAELKGTGVLGELEETLSPDGLYTLSETKLIKKSFSLIAQEPKDGAYVTGVGKSIPVKFSWKSKKKTKWAQIEISKQRDFSSIILKKEVTASSFTKKLEEGLYYWRVKTPDSKHSIKDRKARENYSIVRKFRVVSQKPILSYAPSEGELFSYRDEIPFVNFSWSKLPNVSFYSLELAKDKEFKEMIIKKDTSSVNYGADLEAGEYYWRVSIKDNLTASTLRSKVKRFKVVRKEKAKFSIKLNFISGQKLNRRSLAKEGFVISWKDHPETFRTEFTIAEDRNFSKLVKQEKLSVNFYHLKEKLKEKIYYYKMKAYDKEGRLLAAPLIGFFRVEAAKVGLTGFLLLKPRNNSSLQKGDIFAKGIRFSWSKFSVEQEEWKYTFLLAKDRNFKKIIVEKDRQKEELLSKDIKKNGLYFWKVKAIDTSDNSALGETKVFSFFVDQMALMSVKGRKVRGRIVKIEGSSVRISTPEGIIEAQVDEIDGNILHSY